MRILVVDDDIMTLEVLKHGLESHGHEVTTGESGYKALCLIDERNYDVVLCDVFMPELSGFVVANILQQQAIPFLLMSGEKNVGLYVRQQFPHGCEFLAKPLKMEELLEKINAVCPQRAAAG